MVFTYYILISINVNTEQYELYIIVCRLGNTLIRIISSLFIYHILKDNMIRIYCMKAEYYLYKYTYYNIVISKILFYIIIIIILKNHYNINRTVFKLLISKYIGT